MLIELYLVSGHIIKNIVWEKNLEDLLPIVTKGDFDSKETMIFIDRDKNSYIVMVKDIQAIKFIPIKTRLEIN